MMVMVGGDVALMAMMITMMSWLNEAGWMDCWETGHAAGETVSRRFVWTVMYGLGLTDCDVLVYYLSVAFSHGLSHGWTLDGSRHTCMCWTARTRRIFALFGIKDAIVRREQERSEIQIESFHQQFSSFAHASFCAVSLACWAPGLSLPSLCPGRQQQLSHRDRPKFWWSPSKLSPANSAPPDQVDPIWSSPSFRVPGPLPPVPAGTVA
ncbi:hypothetical protein GE09DRAFT_151984 [Coniochaeta sp. 2T2.1]|nr:hypothetical protein GE09DRAFT_151984 [Coniochaeta sp. 2T2.1]